MFLEEDRLAIEGLGALVGRETDGREATTAALCLINPAIENLVHSVHWVLAQSR